MIYTTHITPSDTDFEGFDHIKWDCTADEADRFFTKYLIEYINDVPMVGDAISLTNENGEVIRSVAVKGDGERHWIAEDVAIV